ncbi:hypothetical protein PV326_011742 [Microctonus aethiopoides]|nr:hypothetical protein PV326_011742 [Microctonus aethiopoides]
MINIRAICDWAGTNPKQRNFVEGERILKAGHIIKCCKNKNLNELSDTVDFTAYCLKTSKLKEIPHEINGKVQLNGRIMSVQCSCKAGLGEQCKHIIATLLYSFAKEQLGRHKSVVRTIESNSHSLSNEIDRNALEAIFNHQINDVSTLIENVKIDSTVLLASSKTVSNNGQYTEYGKSTGKEVLQVYIEKRGEQVLQTGLIISPQNP